MAVEDIPPRRQRGLGDRLSDILSRMAETVGAPEEERLGYEDYLFGGAGTATTEQVESALESVAPREVAVTLPIPEYIDYVSQSNARGVRTKRPDRKESFGYYSSNNPPNYQSTRVHAIQWIPTAITTQLITTNKDAELYGQAAQFKDYNLGSPAVFGDILVAFARPSNVQSHSLYIYEHNAESVWSAFKSSTSLGKFINRLNGGRQYTSGDGERYKRLHATTMDGGYPYDYWIFNEMSRWSVIRPNNERL